jgi:hypothetical protein
MKRTTSYLNIASLIAAAACIFFFQACRKTEYENIKRPYAEIERFAIAGYNGIDSIPAVIADDTIFIYWNPDADHPENIRPHIVVSTGATITPASGEQVSFSGQTVYTVTAEDGSVKKYTLKPVFNIPVPTLFNVTAARTWSATTPIVINGEYFLSTGDVKDIRVYAQRLRDGFEFDLPLDTPNITATRINAYLPKFTAEFDTGAHRIYVKVGEFASNVAPIWISQPPLTEIISAVIPDRIGNLKLNEELTLQFVPKEEWEVAFDKYYGPEKLSTFSLGLQPIILGGSANGTSFTIPEEYLTASERGKVKIKLDPTFFAAHISKRIFGGTIRHTGVSSINGTGGFSNYQFTTTSIPQLMELRVEETIYADLSFQQEGQQINSGQELTINYSFSNEEYRASYQGRANQVQLGFRDASGVLTTVIIPATGITDNGTQVKFAIPTTAAVAGKSLVMVGVNLAHATNTRLAVLPRHTITQNTVIAN